MNLNKFYDKSYDWILAHGPNIILAFFVLIVGLWVIRLIKKWLGGRMHHHEFDPSLRPFLQSILIIALQVMLVLAVMQILGLQLTIFTTIIGAFGVAAGLALSGTLQNFASGVLILILKPFRVGDNIIAQGQEGTVTTIQIFYTVVTTYDNKTVIFPNSKLSNEVIINISRQGKRRLDIEFKFSFGESSENVKTIILKSLSDMKLCMKKPEPRVGVLTLEPDGFRLGVNVWVNAHGFQDSKLAIQEKLMNDLKSAGIKLPGT
ncbi:mechanosensitive ion channel [Pedobacter sp. HMF7647]|uniref:Mechanosensitive ion channel n=1 Tax=Hufsiella arboris TaxID=2695275 RepID=A0A7K1Y4D2_9SPHI|nr:mechanosensitive ion channel family protein [Hufsiella arboris]MXV49435.1 mechanosensitive ion channel [Hufsiella arboris]